MRSNETIVNVFEIKRQIDLAKVRIATTHPITQKITERTGFVSKSEISEDWIEFYYRQTAGDCLNPFEQDAEAYARINHVD